MSKAIFLNEVLNSGKPSIAKQIQQAKQPFYHLSINDFYRTTNALQNSGLKRRY